MGSSYDSQADAIRRQRMIAEALRQSGNESIQYAPPSGTRAYKHSAWEGINKALQQALGGYQGLKADQAKAELDRQDQANLAQLIGATKSPEDQGFVRPITDVAGVPNPAAMQQDQQLDADRKANLQAAALRGVQFGGTAGPLAGEILQREALPKEPEYLTAADGSNIYQVDKNTGRTKLLISNPKETSPASFQKTDEGLIFDSRSGTYRDSTGRQLSSDEVSQRHAANAASQAAGVTAANNKAKLDAFPKGSLDAMVESYLQTGKVPAAGRNAALLPLFWQGVAERATRDGNTLAQQTAETRMRGSLTGAMDQTQKQLAANQNFAETMHRNIAAADALAKRIGGAGSPAINTLFNKWKRKVTGDPDVASFDVLNNSIVGESAKISSGGVGSVGASSDTQIEHNRQLLNSAQNYAQWRAAADAMLTESGNRIGSIRDQLSGLSQLSQGSGIAPPKPAPTLLSDPRQPKVVNFGDLK